MLDLPLAEPAAIAPPAPAPHPLRLTFSGSGAEYFRIWIVNLLLTLATLGIYSAWAKVRRLQYFDRNTQLDGAAFDFRGDPKAVLRGRLLAVVLLAAYHYAFGISRAIGVAVITGLLLALPFFMRSAMRFRLHNTYYRGLSFSFGGSVAGAYRSYVLPIACFLLPGVVLALAPGRPLLKVAAFLPYLAWPLMHAVMKRYQHGHLRYGGAASHYDVPARRFWRPYLLACLFALGGFIAATLFAGGVSLLAGASVPQGPGQLSTMMVGFIYILLFVYVAYVLTGPYLQVRIANLAWSNTSLGAVRIQSFMKARGFMKLQTVNVVLTLLTLGLYRPFAVVRVYRYRLAHLALMVEGDFGQLVGTTAARAPGAAGDGVADFLGVDLSW